MKNRGFLMEEVLIACALFVSITFALSTFTSQIEEFISFSSIRIFALKLADQHLEETLFDIKNDFDNATSTSFEITKNKINFVINKTIIKVDNFTKKAEVGVTYEFKNRNISTILSGLVTDTRESEGQNSCRPNQNTNVWKNPHILTFNLSQLHNSIEPTDIDVVGSYAYITSNGALASSPDLFIFDISDISNVTLLSTLNTGPGLSGVQVASNSAYVANTSISGQLQIIDIQSRSKPILLTSYKIPGNYGSSTPIGTSVFYKHNKVFFGTDKNDIEELYYIDVSNPQNLEVLHREEIGNGINDIFAFKDKVYVASPHKDELKVFSISSEGALLPFYSYNDPGATGNGKRLSLFLDTLFLGKTKTFDKEELLGFSDISKSPHIYSRSKTGASVQGVLLYGNVLFSLLRNTLDGFIIFATSSSTKTFIRQNTTPISFPGFPLVMDCDQDLFAVISENSSVITFISPSQP